MASGLRTMPAKGQRTKRERKCPLGMSDGMAGRHSHAHNWNRINKASRSWSRRCKLGKCSRALSEGPLGSRLVEFPDSRRAGVPGTMAMKIIRFVHKTLPNRNQGWRMKMRKIPAQKILCKIEGDGYGVGDAFAPFSPPCGISAQHAFDPTWHLVSLCFFFLFCVLR